MEPWLQLAHLPEVPWNVHEYSNCSDIQTAEKVWELLRCIRKQHTELILSQCETIDKVLWWWENEEAFGMLVGVMCERMENGGSVLQTNKQKTLKICA